MGSKGLDFKHKEVINITDGRRLRICARRNSRFRKWHNHIYNGFKKENRNSRFEFEREQMRKGYTTILDRKKLLIYLNIILENIKEQKFVETIEE